jgi:hypothetical protein
MRKLAALWPLAAAMAAVMTAMRVGVGLGSRCRRGRRNGACRYGRCLGWFLYPAEHAAELREYEREDDEGYEYRSRPDYGYGPHIHGDPLYRHIGMLLGGAALALA